MKAKLIYLSDRQVEFLHNESKRLGTNVSELIRRILDYHIEKESAKTQDRKSVSAKEGFLYDNHSK